MSMIEIENFTSPGHRTKVNAAKFTAMRDAYLAVLPDAPPGLTPGQIIDACARPCRKTCFPVAQRRAGGQRLCNSTLRPRGSSPALSNPCACIGCKAAFLRLPTRPDWLWSGLKGVRS